MYLFLSTSRGNRQIEKDTRGSRSSSITRRGGKVALSHPAVGAGAASEHRRGGLCTLRSSTFHPNVAAVACCSEPVGEREAVCCLCDLSLSRSGLLLLRSGLPQTTKRISSQLFPPVTSATAANSRSLLLSRSPLTPGSRWHSEGVGEAGAAEAWRGACGTAAIWAAGELPRAVSASTQLFGTGDAA